jgi:hypothetical protein
MTAVWMLANRKSEISSYELARFLQITQKSAWLLMRRLDGVLLRGSLPRNPSGSPDSSLGARTRREFKEGPEAAAQFERTMRTLFSIPAASLKRVTRTKSVWAEVDEEVNGPGPGLPKRRIRTGVDA